MIQTQNPKIELPAPPSADLTESLHQGDATAFTTPLAVAFRYIRPTWRNYIMYVDMEARTGNEDARRYLRTWQSLPPRERNTHVPEQLCELATVSAADLIRWVSGQVWIEGTAATSMVLAFNKPRVLESVATAALDPENGRHAEMFLKAAGILSQGGRGGAPAVTIHNMPVASSGSVALAGSRSDSTPVSASGLRDMDSDIVSFSQIMQNGEPAKSRAEYEPDDEDDSDEDDDGPEDDD